MPDVLYQKHDTYAVFTLNRPDRLHAVGGGMRRELDQYVADFDADPAMRVGILTAEGRAFSAGADLREMSDRGASGDAESAPASPAAATSNAFPFSRSPKPFIAAVNGFAIGAGMDMALDCDLRICATGVFFSLPEPRIGILAGYSLDRLPRAIGITAASQMLLTADRVYADQALAWGLVTEVLEPERLMPRAIELAGVIALNAPLAVEATKAVIRIWRETLVPDSERVHELLTTAVRASADAKEGPRAFAEKRRPVWQGR